MKTHHHLFNMASKPWTEHEPAPSILFTNCHVVEPERGMVQRDRTLFISKGKILPPSESTSISHLTIDLQGKYVCPGLIDSHVHLTATPGQGSVRALYDADAATLAFRSAWVAKQMLLRGFTTARDVGGGSAIALRDAIAEGLIAGPRLFVSGKALSQTGGHGDLRAPHEGDALKCCGGDGSPALARVADGVPAVLAAARDELRRGANFLKIMVGGGVASPTDPLDMVQFTAEEIRAIVSAADNLHTYVTAHAYTNDAIRHAVDNGVRGIEHANFIDEETAKYLAEHNVVVTPTLSTYHAVLRPENVHFLSEDGRKKAQAVVDSGVKALKTLTDAGVTVCYGTDLLGAMHPLQHDEFAIRAQALANDEILRSATTYPASLLRMHGQIGSLDSGALADVLVLDKNPLDDLAVFADFGGNCHAILKDGRVVMSTLHTEGLKVDSLYR
jgi:imidazolonepropionase-like amidohydrolase